MFQDKLLARKVKRGLQEVNKLVHGWRGNSINIHASTAQALQVNGITDLNNVIHCVMM